MRLPTSSRGFMIITGKGEEKELGSESLDEVGDRRTQSFPSRKALREAKIHLQQLGLRPNSRDVPDSQDSGVISDHNGQNLVNPC